MTSDWTRAVPLLGKFRGLFEGLRDYEAEPSAITRAVSFALGVRQDRGRIFFIGNGGSAAIASHMAEDFLKAGNFAAMCFNDGAQLTCLANDLGYEKVFAVPLAAHGRSGDILIAISSSGSSRNILQAVEVARPKGLTVITLSGFRPDNPLRKLGDINFYVPSEKYGVVEVAHLAILHAILDQIVEQDQALPAAHAMADYE